MARGQSNNNPTFSRSPGREIENEYSLIRRAMAKAVARLRGRDYVIPGDVKEVFTHTVAHRLILSPKAEAQGLTPEQILRGILDRVPAPKLR